MATLREIRNRIGSIRSTQQITKAMKMVAAAKLRRAQENIEMLRPYAQEVGTLISHLTALSPQITSVPLMRRNQAGRVLTVAVTSDRGLCGAFNHNIVRTTSRRIAEYKELEVDLYPVGKKSMEFFSWVAIHISWLCIDRDIVFGS